MLLSTAKFNDPHSFHITLHSPYTLNHTMAKLFCRMKNMYRFRLLRSSNINWLHFVTSSIRQYPALMIDATNIKKKISQCCSTTFHQVDLENRYDVQFFSVNIRIRISRYVIEYILCRWTFFVRQYCALTWIAFLERQIKKVENLLCLFCYYKLDFSVTHLAQFVEP